MFLLSQRSDQYRKQVMPKLIRNPKPFRGRGGGRIDWSSFADGNQYRMVFGEDFFGDATSLQSSAHQAASRRGMKAQTMTEGKDVIVQFFAIESLSTVNKKQPKG
jgi:hypothetical protein